MTPLNETPPAARHDTARLETVLRAFEAAWQGGPTPALDDFLPPEGDERRALLPELVHADLEFRLACGEPCRVEEYLARYPELQDAPAVVELLAAEYELRHRHGGPTPEEYLARFPEYRRELLAYFHEAPRARVPTGGAGPNFQPRTQSLGKFELLERLGGGTFGTVYKARDTALDRLVAVKILRTGGPAAPEEVERFLREARSAARLRHPGIVAVHGAEQTGDVCYLVSELISGQTLAESLAAGRWSARRAAELLAQVAEAVHEAHTHGIVHRDLKPANILLDPDGRPHVADFGIAKLGGGSTLTLTGELLGTPAYMSPEQARGLAHQADARSDVYSLGTLLYELLTGTVPFTGDREMVLRRILDEDPRSLRRLDAALPRDLETICLKCLQKEPHRRYATAQELADDLRRFLDGKPVQARPVRMAVKLWRWCRRRPVQAGLAACLVLVTVLGFAGVSWQWWRAEGERRAAEDHLAEVERQRLVIKDSFQRAHLALTQYTDLYFHQSLYGPEMDFVRQALVGKPIHYYEDFLCRHGDEPSLVEERALAHLHLAHLYTTLGDSARALEPCRAAVDYFRRLSQERPTDSQMCSFHCQGLLNLSLLLRQAGRAAEAEARQREAQEIFAQLLAGPATANACETLCRYLFSIAKVTRQRGQHAEAIRHYTLSADAAMWCYRKVVPDRMLYLHGVGECFYYLGDLHARAGRSEEALRHCLQAREIYQQARLQEPSVACRKLLARCHYLAATLFDRLQRAKDALGCFEQAAAAFTELLAETPSAASLRRDLAASEHNIGNLHAHLGQPERSLAPYQRAIAHRQRMAQDFPDDIAHMSDLSGSWFRLGRALQRLGRATEALPALRTAVQLQEAVVARAPTAKRERRYLEERTGTLVNLLNERGRPVAAAPGQTSR